jgi:succinate dehydrogenase / fumarate reductase cytochrome b subunit
MRHPAERPLSPHLSVYRPMYTMVLSILHRASGLWLSAAGFGLIAWLVAAALGPEAYDAFLRCLSSLPMRIALLAVLAAFWYHLFAGLRHLAWDAGLGFEKSSARASGAAVVLATAAALVAMLLLTPAGRLLEVP